MQSVRVEMYYTYAYLREDGTPYYIGKGKGYRAFVKNGRTVPPPNKKSNIILLKQNLTEDEAFRHEEYMIYIFGRKDLGTGILRNMSNGKDGCSGYIFDEEERQKRKDRMKNLPKEKHPAFGKKREDISKIMLGDKNPMKDPKILEKFSGKNSNWSKKWKVYFDDGRIMEFHSIRKWCLENNYDPSLVSKVCKGRYKKHKDIVKVEFL
jgi:hypothetical protein